MTDQELPRDEPERSGRPTVDDVDPAALAVNSVDDITRMHGDGDETNQVVTAAGDIQPVETPDLEDDDGTGSNT